jgi:aryl-alcohol dehydrogenase-like predicted oxidoreductase
MKTRPFGKSGEAVSEVGIGTWQIGGTEWGEVTDEQALQTLRAAGDSGVTFIDTADIYGGGRSEELIGKFLREPGRSRAKFFIATKLGRRSDPGWPANFTPDAIKRHTEASLERLGVSQIDLTQTHCIPHDVMKKTDVWKTFAQLQSQKLIKHWGASVESMDEAMTCLDRGVESLQIIFNVFRQKPAEVLFERARKQGVAIVVRLPLASGLLSGKMKKDTKFTERDHRAFNRDGAAFNVGETFAGLPYEKGVELAGTVRISVRDGMTMAQFALRWCLDFDAVTTVIPGAKRPQQAKENAAASKFPPLSKFAHESLRGFYIDEVAPYIRGPY